MALTSNRVDVPVIVDESKCLDKCKACIEVCPLDVLVKNPDTGKWMEKFYTINDTWKSEDRRKLLAYARDLLNSDYGGHRLTFQLFAQSAPFAQSGAVYRNFDWDATLEFVQKSAGLSDNVFKPNKINNGDPAIQKWYENKFKEAAE